VGVWCSPRPGDFVETDDAIWEILVYRSRSDLLKGAYDPRLRVLTIGCEMVDGRWTSIIAAASGARGHVRDTIGRVAEGARDVGDGAGNVATGLAELVARIEGPVLPLREIWSVGLGQLLADHPKLPDQLRGVVGHLDRLGQLQLSPTMISFDGHVAGWDKVEEITFGPPMDVITSHALQHEVGRLTALLPPVPGRAWLVRQAVGVLVALCLAVAERATTDESPDAGDGDRDTVPGIPVSVTYGGLVRRKDLTPGVFAALVAASTPTFSEAITLMARDRGIRVTVAPPSRSRRQAIVLRQLADSMVGRFGRGDEPPAIESADSVPAVDPN
jgi:hypothetical protein